VGRKVLDLLGDVDQVAYVRFASVYREFQDTQEFIALLEKMSRESKTPDEPEPTESSPRETVSGPGG